jgi:hypothetical protein
MRINRFWIGLAAGFSVGLGFQYVDFRVKKQVLSMTTFDALQFYEWVSYYQILMSTALAGIVGFLFQKRAVAKREAEEIMGAMKSGKQSQGQIFK